MDYVFRGDRSCAISNGALLVWLYVVARDAPKPIKIRLEEQWSEIFTEDLGMIDPMFDRLAEDGNVDSYLAKRAPELAEMGLRLSRKEARDACLGGDHARVSDGLL